MAFSVCTPGLACRHPTAAEPTAGEIGSVLATSATASVPPELGPPEPYRIPRENDRDLAFTGWVLGTSTQPKKCWHAITGDSQEVDAGIDVRIYASEGGRIVTHSFRWTEFARHAEGDEWDNFTGERYRAGTHNAAWHINVEAALDWLRQDGGGRLGESSKAAWTQACRHWPELAPHEVEAVDAMKAPVQLSLEQ